MFPHRNMKAFALLLQRAPAFAVCDDFSPRELVHVHVYLAVCGCQVLSDLFWFQFVDSLASEAVVECKPENVLARALGVSSLFSSELRFWLARAKEQEDWGAYILENASPKEKEIIMRAIHVENEIRTGKTMLRNFTENARAGPN